MPNHVTNRISYDGYNKKNKCSMRLLIGGKNGTSNSSGKNEKWR